MKTPNYFRQVKRIIPLDNEGKQDLSQKVEEFPSINAAKRRSLELTRSGKLVRLFPKD